MTVVDDSMPLVAALEAEPRKVQRELSRVALDRFATQNKTGTTRDSRSILWCDGCTRSVVAGVSRFFLRQRFLRSRFLLERL